MSKLHPCLLSFLLILIFLAPGFMMAEDLVGIKNLSWEEQKNRTKIVLETTKPLVYNVTSPQSTSEVQVEVANLDLKNMPQELFINTNEVVSLQTFPQTAGQNAKIILKLSSILPYEVKTEGSNLYVEIMSKGDGDGLLAPVAQPASKPAAEQTPAPVTPEPQALQKQETAPAETPQSVTEQAPAATPVAEPAEAHATELKKVAPATEVRDVRIEEEQNHVDVVLVGNGSFTYETFELSNPTRIVVDLKSVSVAAGVKSVVQASNEMLSRVRVAQYQTSPKVARAVIDLNSKVPYSVTPKGSELLIQIGESKVSENQSDPAMDTTDDAASEPEVTSAPAPATSEPEQVAEPASPEPAMVESTTPVELPPSMPAPTESMKVAAKESEQMVAKNEEKPVEAVPQNNEQFFTFKPDTSLFAQETGSTGSAGSTGSTTTSTEGAGGYGMGSFGDKTLRSGEKQYTGEPFSFDFKDIDIKDLFRFIADISGLNVILDPAVKGSVTLKLTEVPWDQALDLITKNQGLGYTIEGNVIRIAPVQKIADEERKRAEQERQMMLSAPLVTKIKPLSYAKAADVDRVVKRLLTPKGTSIIDTRTNTLIITDINTNIDAIMNLIDTLDSRTAQVLIEARIVETRKNFSQAFGIQWGFRGIVDPTFGNNTTLQFPNNVLLDGAPLTATGGLTNNPLGGYAVNLPTDAAPNSAIGLSLGNILDTFRLDIALMALENSGNARVLSSPKVATQNNTKAEILQGQQIPYQTIANNTITTTFINAALRMSVTPQITSEGTIIMDIELENNSPDFSHLVGAAGGTPPINIERATTTLLVEDGGTTVIGGIFQNSDSYAQGRTPILHRIPLLGWLFKNTNVNRTNSELLIFITPRILR